MRTKQKTINTRAIVLLALGVIVAFLPTISRFFGHELLLSNSTRTDEWLTLLTSLVGGALIGLSFSTWNAENGHRMKGLAFAIGIIASIIALAANVLSIFAFTL